MSGLGQTDSIYVKTKTRLDGNFQVGTHRLPQYPPCRNVKEIEKYSDLLEEMKDYSLFDCLKVYFHIYLLYIYFVFQTRVDWSEML